MATLHEDFGTSVRPGRRETPARDVTAREADGWRRSVDEPGRETMLDLEFEAAWEHRGTLTDMCQRIVGDRGLAEDSVQEAYLQLVRHWRGLEERGDIVRWLMTVAKRRCLNELRGRRRATYLETPPERTTAPEDDPCEISLVADEVERVGRVLDQLTEREHDLLKQQVYRGRSLAELAALDGSSEASVRSVLCRARSKLRAATRDYSRLRAVGPGPWRNNS